MSTSHPGPQHWGQADGPEYPDPRTQNWPTGSRPSQAPPTQQPGAHHPRGAQPQPSSDFYRQSMQQSTAYPLDDAAHPHQQSRLGSQQPEHYREQSGQTGFTSAGYPGQAQRAGYPPQAQQADYRNQPTHSAVLGQPQPGYLNAGYPQSGAPQSSSVPGAKKKGKIAVIVVSAIALVVVLGLVAVFAFRAQMNRFDPPEPIAPGADLHPLTNDEDWLIDDYRNGGELRQEAIHEIFAYDAASGIYVVRVDANMFGRDLASGETKWEAPSELCAAAVNGKTYCTVGSDETVYLLNPATGEFTKKYRLPTEAQYVDEYLGEMNGFEIFNFAGKEQNIIAAGKNDHWEWLRPVEGKLVRCSLLYEKIGCSSEKTLNVIEPANGKIDYQRELSDNVIRWYNDGFSYFVKDDNRYHIYDLQGNELGKRLLQVKQPEGLFAVADAARDVSVVDHDGNIVVARKGGKEVFPNGHQLDGYHGWKGVSKDGKVLASLHEEDLLLLDNSGAEIGRFSNAKVATLNRGLLVVSVNGKEHLVVPKR